MHSGKTITVTAFTDKSNPVISIASDQGKYVRSYLLGLGVTTVIVEQNYFDRDYLDEFSIFYSKSAKGYPNICQRVHFFSEPFNKDLFKLALADNEGALNTLRSSYLGFCVLRPIPQSPFARTVLAWYPDSQDGSYRVNNPSREYLAVVAGIELKVTGLAWQQQDSGVSACATIGIWTMLHSSAFDDHHSIPTTAAITQAAHENASLGDRIFPSQGLKPHQILEAIKAQNLTPVVSYGDLKQESALPLFSTKKFASTCTAFVRSGYPVIVIGKYLHLNSAEGHMVCIVGFKESSQHTINPGDYRPMNEEAKFFYVHDDNLGPNVRCELTSVEIDGTDSAALITSPPPYVDDAIKEPKQQFQFLPNQLIIAVHEELRISSDKFYNRASQYTHQITTLLSQAYKNSGKSPPKIVFSARFLTIRNYLGTELPRLCGNRKDILGRARLSLAEEAPPMSLHLGLIRIAILNGDKQDLVVDIICDTTDSERNQLVFAHVLFDSVLTNLLAKLPPDVLAANFGTQILAHD